VKVGVDIIEIERVRRALERPGFRERCFTDAERHYCDSRRDPAESYAARFAGKEAVGKALGCGVRFTWKDVEIVGRPKPSVRLSGRTAAFAVKVDAGPIDLSMTHSREIAAAIAVVVPGGDAGGQASP
jgi:holo-[acyl-carrier protein] synthase